MSARRTILFLILLLAVPTPIHAAPPAVARIDPQAPSYRWPAVDWDGDGVFDRVDHCNDTPKGCTVDEYGCSVDQDRDGVCDGLDRCPGSVAGMEVDEHGCAANQRAMGRVQPPTPEPPREIEQPAPRPEPPAKPVSESERQLVESGRIRLENVYFETDSAELLPESEASLREAGEALEKFPSLRIEVEGHTDTRGTRQHNQRLSQGRAGTVRAGCSTISGCGPKTWWPWDTARSAPRRGSATTRSCCAIAGSCSRCSTRRRCRKA